MNRDTLKQIMVDQVSSIITVSIRYKTKSFYVPTVLGCI